MRSGERVRAETLRLCRASCVLFALGACATLPTTTGRDARILPEGARTVDVTGNVAFGFTDGYGGQPPGDDAEAYLGGPQFNLTVREGRGDGAERAFRASLSAIGAYGGYERAHALSTGKWAGIVGYYGGVAGAHLVQGLYPFAQPYAGMVLGITRSPVRPELALRVAGQAGIVSRDERSGAFYGYGVGFVSAEPRLRVALGEVTAYGGLTLGTGYGRCQECFASARSEVFYVVSVAGGVSIDVSWPVRRDSLAEELSGMFKTPRPERRY